MAIGCISSENLVVSGVSMPPASRIPDSVDRLYLEKYAVIRKYWAYINDDYIKAIIKKNVKGKHFRIVEKYQSRPDEMSEDVANAILEKINEK